MASCGGGDDVAKRGSDGRIVFARDVPSEGGSVTFTINPDGSALRRLFSRGSEFPHWSPDGKEVAIFCCDDGMAAHFVNPDSGKFRELAPSDDALETHCGTAWSPDGERLLCESFGVTDPKRNGIYSIRASDGGGLTRITSNPGGDDVQGDYSPDGKRVVFVRSNEAGPIGIFVINVSGTHLLQLTPRSMAVDEFFGGRWSPDGRKILFVATTSANKNRAIWVVNPEGRGLHKLPCAGASCFYPAWSPDGTKIAFTRVPAGTMQENVYIANADGSHVVQVTHAGGGQPDWGR
jgi:TolB protein